MSTQPGNKSKSNKATPKPEVSSVENGSDKAPILKETTKQKETEPKMTSDNDTNPLVIIERVVKCLQKKENDPIPLLKCFLNMVEATGEKGKSIQKLISTLVPYINSSSIDEIKDISKQISGLILPECLRSLVIDIESITPGSLIGQGGYGTVLSGLLRKDNTSVKVAVKFSEKNDSVLKYEAKIMSELNHPNIVKILDMTRNPVTIVMELLPRTLHFNLTEENYSYTRILKSIKDIVAGMEYISKKNIIHRDLAMRNILVDDEYCCKICDFNNSCYADNPQDRTECIGDLHIVTDHSAPEVLHNKSFTTKSDVYSMGLLIWEIFMVAGREPISLLPPFLCFEHPYRAILTILHCSGQLQKPRKMSEDILNFIKRNLLNVDPDRRPTFTDLKSVISRW